MFLIAGLDINRSSPPFAIIDCALRNVSLAHGLQGGHSHLHNSRVAHQPRQIRHSTRSTSSATHTAHHRRQSAHIRHATGSAGASTGRNARIVVFFAVSFFLLLGFGGSLSERLLHVGVVGVEGEALGVGLDGFVVVSERVVGVAEGLVSAWLSKQCGNSSGNMNAGLSSTTLPQLLIRGSEFCGIFHFALHDVSDSQLRGPRRSCIPLFTSPCHGPVPAVTTHGAANPRHPTANLWQATITDKPIIQQPSSTGIR